MLRDLERANVGLEGSSPSPAAGAGSWVNVEERLVRCGRWHHAALCEGRARAKAAKIVRSLGCPLHVVKNARLLAQERRAQFCNYFLAGGSTRSRPARSSTSSPSFEGPPNQTLVNDLAGGSFITQQSNAVLVGGTGTANPIWPTTTTRSCIHPVPADASTMSSISSMARRSRAVTHGRVVSRASDP